MAWAMLLFGRLRVRRAVGFPPDEHDEMAVEILQESLADHGVPQEGEDFTDPATPYAVVTRQASAPSSTSSDRKAQPSLYRPPCRPLTRTVRSVAATPHEAAGADRDAFRASRSRLSARPGIA